MNRLPRFLLAASCLLAVGCTASATSATTDAAPPPVLTGIVTGAAPYGGEWTAVVVEVQNPDGERRIYDCDPLYNSVCVLLKPGDSISFTLQGNAMRDVKRTKAAADTGTKR